MKPLDRLLVKIDPLFKPAPFDEAHWPKGFPLHPAHKELLQRRNGGYFYGGALHIFGACTEPAFHSLSSWNAPDTWRDGYADGTDGLCFFAENAFGDQFGLDEKGRVYKFHAENGAIEELADDVEQFILIAVEAPDEALDRELVASWMAQHGHLPHGSQLQAYPPYIFAEDPDAVDLQSVDAVENMQFHAAINQQLAELSNLPPGQRARIEFTDEGLQIITEPDEGAPPA